MGITKIWLFSLKLKYSTSYTQNDTSLGSLGYILKSNTRLRNSPDKEVFEIIKKKINYWKNYWSL